MKTLSKKILQIITAGYCILYFLGFAAPFFQGEMSLSNSEDLSVLLMFIFFFVGFIVSWFKEQIGGILLQVWFVFICLLSSFFWTEAGMILILGFPVLVIGVLLNLKAYKASGEQKPTKQMQWKYALRLFLINYSLLYVITVVTALTSNNSHDYFSLPFVLFPILFIVFIAGFILSWKRDLLAGIIFIIWYGIIIFGSVTYFDFFNEGPWVLIGLPILLQGLFYIINHFRFKPIKK